MKAAEAAALSEIFGGHIGTVLAVSKTPKRKKALEQAGALAAAAHAHDAYTAGTLLAVYEKDKPGAVQFLNDFMALVAAGMSGNAHSPLSGRMAIRAIRSAQEATRQLGANVNTKAVLTLLAMRLGKV